MTQAPPYRPDIDGLRAIAVISVLVFHYGAAFPFPLLPGGFTGVDVFFVISGFLITAKLAEEIRDGTFSLLGFYDRRVRRILPALTAMLAVVLFAGRFLLLPGDYAALASSAAAAAFGVSNVFFLQHTGYFDQTADLMPLLHTWSLAVEEQFYLVWPLALFAIAAGRRRIDVAALVGVTVIIAFGASLFWFDADPKAAFFLAAPRAWELALGAALVFLPPLPRRAGGATGLGLVLIAAGFLRIEANAFPGAAALLPCLGAALLIWPQREPSMSAQWLGRLAPLGLISYSLYLWHWPVWVFYRVYINNGQPRIREAFALAAVSIALAVLSYRFIEQPLRRKRAAAAVNVWAGLAASTTILCAAGYVAIADGFPARLSRELHAMRSLEAMWEWPCARRDLSADIKDICVFGAPWTEGSDKAVLWGDSIAESLAPLLEQAASDAGFGVALYHACAPLLDGKSVLMTSYPGAPADYNNYCGATRERLFIELARSPEIRTVILSASWQPTLNNLAGDREPQFASGLADTLAHLAALGKAAVVIATPPQWPHDPLPCEIRAAGLWRRQCSDEYRILAAAYDRTNQARSLALLQQSAAAHAEVRLLVPSRGLCAGSNCITEFNGEPLYRDEAHLRRNLSAATRRDLARIMGLDRIFLARP